MPIPTALSQTHYDLIYDRETYELAHTMVDNLGPSALYEALNKVELHEKEGNAWKAHLWRRIESAITILLSDDHRGLLH